MLMSRYWHIDGLGCSQEARAGRRGAQPVIAPGQTFQYTSGCPLADRVGPHGRALPDADRVR